MTISRRSFLRGSAQMTLAAPLLGAAVPLIGNAQTLGDSPPVGKDFSLITRPFVGTKIAAKDITQQEVGGLALFSGAGCNVVALAGPEGALVVDGGQAVNAAVLQKALHGRLGTRRIQTLVNTHWHPDQTGLNEVAAKDRATIVGHEVTRLYMGRKVRSPLYDGTIGPLPEAARPSVTTYDQGTLQFAGEEVQYRHLPAAHTGGDLCVWFPKRNVLVAGGPVTSDRWPVMDYINGAFMHGFVRSYEIMSGMVKPDTIVVPAHGPVMTGAEIVKMKDLYWELFKQFFVMFNKGFGAEDVIAAQPLKEHEGQFGDPAQFLEAAYRSVQLATIPH